MPCLVYRSNRGERRVFELDPTIVPISIGRAPGSTIRTSNASVSRNHGRVGLEDGQYFVKDTGSRNGTYVNGDPIKKTPISDGDVVHFGEFVVVFLLNGADAAKVPDPDLRAGPVKQHKTAQSRRAARPAEPARKAAPRSATQPGIAPEPAAAAPSGGKSRARPKKARPMAATVEGAVPSPAEAAAAALRPGKATDEGQVQRYLDRIAELTGARDEIAQELDDVKRQLAQSEKRISRLSGQEGRMEVELEAISDKYRELKEQSRRQSELIEKLRDQIAEKDEKIFDLDRELADARSEFQQVKDQFGGSQDVINDLKVQVTRRDRNLEDLQRQLDLTEYELRKAREELETRDLDFNREAGDLHKMERRLQHLQEILEEKESHVESLRLELKEKDVQIQLIRQGAGMEDLEAEKRKLLEDFYNKSREYEQLQSDKREVDFELKEATQRAEEFEARVDKLKDRKIDVAVHPEFKRIQRELDALVQEQGELSAELEAARAQIESFPPEERERLENEIRFLKRKMDATKEQLQRAQEASRERETQAETGEGQRAAPALDPEALTGLNEAFEQWRTNQTLLKSYVRDLLEVSDKVPADALEVIEGVEDLVTIIQADARSLGKSIRKLSPSGGGSA